MLKIAVLFLNGSTSVVSCGRLIRHGLPALLNLNLNYLCVRTVAPLFRWALHHRPMMYYDLQKYL